MAQESIERDSTSFCWDDDIKEIVHLLMKKLKRLELI